MHIPDMENGICNEKCNGLSTWGYEYCRSCPTELKFLVVSGTIAIPHESSGHVREYLI